MLIFFTFLTLHTATCIPGETLSGIPIQCVDDCGCFGDAMKDSIGRSLTPWESFIKDILLIVFTIPIIILDRRKSLNSLFCFFFDFHLNLELYFLLVLSCIIFDYFIYILFNYKKILQ